MSTNAIKYSIIIFTAVTGSCFYSCKDESLCKWDNMPNSLALRIFKSGIAVSHEDLRKCRLSYYDKGTKKYISDFSPFNIEVSQQNTGLITTRSVGTLSADSNIKTYYIEYPNEWSIDTLRVDYLPRTQATNCLYLQNEIRVNKQPASIDSILRDDFPDFQIYLVFKP